jgi:hypothetical protein
MDVVIDGKLYKATEHSIIAILGSKDRLNISNMADGATRYGSFPCETTHEEAEKMLLETLIENKKEVQHCCGLTGFGALGDECPACKKMWEEWDIKKNKSETA